MKCFTYSKRLFLIITNNCYKLLLFQDEYTFECVCCFTRINLFRSNGVSRWAFRWNTQITYCNGSSSVVIHCPSCVVHRVSWISIFFLRLYTNFLPNLVCSRGSWSKADIVCLFVVYRPIREFFTHMKTSPLPVKGCKCWPMRGTHGHWAVRVL